MDAKVKKDEWFERCWLAYNRKGAKKVAKSQWDKLPAASRVRAEVHIPFYVATRERMYCKDFERYLRDQVFDNPVYDSKGNIVFDPDESTSADNNERLIGFQG